jgi:5-methylcytosine-specific restriction endonuclease McrA
MPVCSRCHAQVGVVGLLSFNTQAKICGKCDKEIQGQLGHFRALFIEYCRDGILSSDEWNTLQDTANYYRLNWEMALAYVRGDALDYLRRQIAFAAADGFVTKQEETAIQNWQTVLKLPVELVKPSLEELRYLRTISRIREGQLPVLPTNANLHLESDESCHLDIAARYYRINARSVSHIEGRFVGTNKKLNFLSPSGGWDIQWKRIMRIEQTHQGVYLELSTKKGNGQYDVADPRYAEAVITTIVRKQKRDLVSTSSDLSRRIPHDVKVTVWQRDQGRCVQCAAADYLEYDHDIPFSKGGASTVGNVRLLCRRCNLAKGNRI